MPEKHDPIQIDLSPATQRSIRAAQARRKSVVESITSTIEAFAGTVVIVAFGALVVTLILFAILWLLERMPPLPF